MGTGNGWSLYVGSAQGAVASYAVDTNTYVSYPNSLKVSVTNGGTVSTAIQLENKFGSYILTNSRWYTYSFWAKVSSGTYNLTGYIGMVSAPYTSYGPVNVNLTTSWQKFSKTFQFTGANSDAQEMNLFLGSAAASGLDIYFDNVTISPGAASPEAQSLVVRDNGTVLMEGNVGIGTTIPLSKLHVTDASTTAIVWPLIVNNSDNVVSGAYGVGLKLKTSSNGEASKWAGIAAVNEGNWAQTIGMAFYTKNDPSYLGVLPAEVMRISATGNLGIGTTNPTAPFTIYKDGAANIGSFLLDQPTVPTGLTSKGPHFFFKSGGIDRGWFGFFDNASHGSGTALNLRSAGDVRLAASIGGNPDMIIKVGGNIGIGTTTLDARLKVVTPTGTGNAINTAGGIITGLGDPATSTDAVPYKFLTDNFLPLGTTIKSVYVTSTAATSTGDNKINGAGTIGYVAANSLCNTASAGSHVCTPDEILNTINSGLGSRIPIAQIWIFSGPPGFTANAMDCGGRTVGLGVDNYGTTWYKSATNGEGYGSLAFCNQGYKLACCK
jgi:hypothetical protein